MEAGARVHVLGDGGAEFDIDIPRPGSLARERFDEQIRKGQIVIVGSDPRMASRAPGDELPVVNGEPPRQGPGATREAWAKYATETLKLDVNGMNRAEIMAAIGNRVGNELVEPESD